jgi:sec-independent protein translocase protein TatA
VAVTSLALFNLGGEEILVILVIFMLLFGADKVPQVARQLGRLRAEMQRVQKQVETAIQTEEERVLEDQLAFEEMRERHIAQQDAELFQLKRAAQELGLDATGKTKDELRAAIREHVGGGDAEPALAEKEP